MKRTILFSILLSVLLFVQQTTIAADDMASYFSDPIGFRVYSGYGRRLNKVDPELDQLEKTHAIYWINGIVIGSDLVIYLNKAKSCGLGLKYQIMHSQGSSMMDIHSNMGRLEDKVNISYLGPVFSQRFTLNEGQNVLMYNIGMGWLFYDWRGEINKANGNMSGQTIGATLDINYSRMIKKKLAVGVDLSLTTGALSSYDTFDGVKRITVQLENNKKEGLTHMGLSLQLLYKF